MEWIVSPGESGTKLQIFLKNKVGEGVSARQVKKAIESNLCFVNGRAQRFATFTVGNGDIVSFRYNLADTSFGTKPQFERNRILYEDDFLLIYNKPPAVSSESKEFISAMHSYDSKLILLHRLDRDTTGALLFAKTVEMQKKMISLFRKHQVEKSYLALVDGIPTANKGIIENYLGKVHAYEGQVLWGEVPKCEGLHAKTIWKGERFGKEAALLLCHPITGRTHQIRVHLNGIGHPILGDFQYGKHFRCKYRTERFLLHASKISFVHPMSDVDIHVKAMLPNDFKEAMNEVLLT
jgi:RluA family pseudouridine synthase